MKGERCDALDATSQRCPHRSVIIIVIKSLSYLVALNVCPSHLKIWRADSRFVGTVNISVQNAPEAQNTGLNRGDDILVV